MGNNLTKRSFTQSALYMDTIVTIKIVTSRPEAEATEKIMRAFTAFEFVQNACNRFDEGSEISRLVQQIGVPVPVSDILFETLRFAREMADMSDGAFDPTIGNTLQMYGFNRNYLTGLRSDCALDLSPSANYQDVLLDEKERTILLRKPLILDLGAVAKGLAVDLAVKELQDCAGFIIDAGGDIYAGGLNEQDKPWVIGVRHPLHQEEIICSLQLTNAAVCTSGSYERVSPIKANTHHLIDPRTGISQADILSCTVIAPFAMMADAFSTTTFILGQEKGLTQLENIGLDGLLITPNLEMPMTKEMKRYLL